MQSLFYYVLYNVGIDTNRIPAVYLEEMVGDQDYTNDAKDGLSFKKKQSVFVLLRNSNGW